MYKETGEEVSRVFTMCYNIAIFKIDVT